MIPSSHEIHRRRELLERWREARLEELLQDLRKQAQNEKERGHFAWKGAFRSRAEIEELYIKRKRWGRRLLVDTLCISLVCSCALYFGPIVLKMLLPLS